MRNHFWRQNNLWPEDLAKFPTFLQLGGDDPLVPSHSIKIMFEVANQANTNVLFENDAIHGHFWRDEALMKKVLQEVKTTVHQGIARLSDPVLGITRGTSEISNVDPPTPKAR